MNELDVATVTDQAIEAVVRALEQRAQAIQERLTCLEMYLAEYNELAREKRNISRLLQKYEARRRHEEARL